VPRPGSFEVLGKGGSRIFYFYIPIVCYRTTDKEEEDKKEKKKERKEKERKKRKDEEDDGEGQWERVKGGVALPLVSHSSTIFIFYVTIGGPKAPYLTISMN
jgi:hypothetical protein